MVLTKLILTVETNREGRISLKSFEIEPIDQREVPFTGAEIRPQTLEETVTEYIASLSSNGHEEQILKMLIKARRNSTSLYRKEILDALGFDQLLQWNGVAAWLTRRWRIVTGVRTAEIIARRRDSLKQDYEVTFASGINDNVVDLLADGLGMSEGNHE